MSRVAKLHTRIMYVVNSTWPNIFSVGTCVWQRRPTLAEPLNPGSAQHVWRWWDARVQHFHHQRSRLNKPINVGSCKLFGQWWRLDATFRTIDRYTVLLKLGVHGRVVLIQHFQMWKITLNIFYRDSSTPAVDLKPRRWLDSGSPRALLKSPTDYRYTLGPSYSKQMWMQFN